MTRFWMVYVEWNDGPNATHLTQQEAAKDAERLAQVVGKPVYVLQTVSICTPTHEVKWEDLT